MIKSGKIQHYNSYAKINLGLNVLNKRKDGYHNLHSLFVEIELTDELLFTPSEMYQLTVEGDQTIDLPLDENNRGRIPCPSGSRAMIGCSVAASPSRRQ